MREAEFYRKTEDRTVQCALCPNECVIKDGARGRCHVRLNKDGILYSEVYNKTTSMALDPVEKKPLYHFHRGEVILSLGTKGCNFSCPWCQNWRISQNDGAALSDITAGEAVRAAKEHGSFGIAYTYNEPFIWYEFMNECTRVAHEAGLKNVVVTNGYVNPEPFDAIRPFIDAMNIDLKSDSDDFYKRYCGGKRAPVRRTIQEAKKHGIHVEITTLIIPTLNDSDSELTSLVTWIAQHVGPDTPLHLSRYFPCHSMSIEATPLRTLKRAESIARERLRYVYLGNV